MELVGKLYRLSLEVLFFSPVTVNTTIIFAVLCSEFSKLKKEMVRVITGQ